MSVPRPEPHRGSHPTPVPAPGPTASIFCFSIHAQADPGVMPRVLQLFAKRNLVPTRWHSDVLGGRDLAIDVQIEGVSPELGSYIARCLRQIPGVATVLTAEKRASAGREPGALSA